MVDEVAAAVATCDEEEARYVVINLLDDVMTVGLPHRFQSHD